MDVRLPNGFIIQNVPDGTSKTEIMRKAVNAGVAKYEDFADKSDPMLNPANESFTENALAGAGKSAVDLGRGVRQIAANVGVGDKAAVQKEIDDSRKRDAPLMSTGAGLVGNIAGNIAMTAVPGMGLSKLGAVANMPRLAAVGQALTAPASYRSAAAVGAGMAGLMPTATGESRLANAGLGALGGAAGKFVGDELVGRIFRPSHTDLPAARQALVDAAQQEGIPLTAGQRTGSPALGYIESALEAIPSTSGAQGAINQAQREAYTRAVLRHAGIDSAEASPQVLGAQKSALGQTFEDIASRNGIDFNQGAVTNSLSDAANEASRRLPGSNASTITNTVDDILADVGPDGVMPGAKYQGWREKLRTLSKGNDTTAHYFGQVKKALDDAFNGQISGEDAAAWKDASLKYANLKTTLQAMGGAGEQAALNQVPPAQLAAALRNAMGKEGRALGRGDLDELARIGTSLLKPQPNAGTAQRQLAQTLITGGGPAALTYLATQDPKKAAEAAAIGAGGSMALPKLIQSLMMSRTGQAYLGSNITKNATPEVQALINALRQGAALGGATLAPQVVHSAQ